MGTIIFCITWTCSVYLRIAITHPSNKRINNFLIEVGFVKCFLEHGVYVHDAGRRSRIILCVYVDDLLITGSDEGRIKGCKVELMREFEMSDLGNLSYFLGMEFKNTSQWVLLNH